MILKFFSNISYQDVNTLGNELLKVLARTE